MVDCSTGPLSFLHVNVSGGEFREVQDNMRGKPAVIVTVDDEGGSITGAAVWRELIDGIIYCIYPNKSRAHINAWTRINARVQHFKVNRCLYKMRKGLI